MQTTIGGVAYNTEQDEPITWYGKDDLSVLYQTPAGRFYLKRRVQQVFADGEWQNLDDHREPDEEDGVAALARLGIPADFPHPRRRILDVVRPLTDDEAYRWCVENYMPECFQARALQAA